MKVPKNNDPKNPKTTSDSKIKAAKMTKCNLYLKRKKKARAIHFNSRQMGTDSNNKKWMNRIKDPQAGDMTTLDNAITEQYKVYG